MPYARLPARALLRVTGADAETFLQTLVTADLDRLQQGEARPAALLSPQGKILFDFLLSRCEDGFRVDVAREARADLQKRLTLYKLRAKVTIAPDEEAVFAVWDEDGPWLADRRFVGERVGRQYGDAPAGGEEAGAEAFEARRVRAGIAEAVSDFPPAEMFPHDVLLDQNGGVSFRKGCFVGQEVVSRMQHRGTARRRLVLVSAERHLTPGAVVSAGARTLGTLLAATGADGFALVRIDRLAEALSAGETIAADGVPLTATIPPWAGYALPTEAEGSDALA
ncbi:folate-binding protein YgfZ [Aurantimonas sp. Leaf443]|uniref:CAF17-like 4Fe-4S cluster assembly/insertion protein YgfZ n=1 Tax=Aurantimonas sp. Leaf443 TaxID=1736378 RepID=UPI0006FFF158|nr:folate-binding protein YgfZ [Aurantimonas sp. Leaf443]KQT88289.1 aminomethyltransferase [Aurantimonas sp. Leaf443]